MVILQKGADLQRGPGFRPAVFPYPGPLAHVPARRYNKIAFDKALAGVKADIRPQTQRGTTMKSAARLALILACLGIGLSFSQYFVQYLPRLGLGGQNTMMFVYLIIAPLSILLHSLPVIILAYAIMRSKED